MHKLTVGIGILHRLRQTAALCGAISATLMGLVGCADTHWERAFYQGTVYSNDQCHLKRRPTDAPCTEVLDFESYERERARAKNEYPPSARTYPIEEQQL